MTSLKTYILNHKWSYLAAILSMIISVSLDMLSPQLTRIMIDDVIINQNLTYFIPLLIGMAGIGIGRCCFQYSKEYLFDKTGSRIASDMRIELFSHIQSLSADFFDKNNTGELMARVKDDIDRIWESLTFIVMLMIEVVLHTGIVLYCMFRIDARLAIIPTIFMLLSASLAMIMEQKLGIIYEEISEENAVLNRVAEENLAGVRTVKAFAREKHEIAKFLSHNQKFYELNMKQSNIFIRFYPYFQLITKLLPLLVILGGGYFVIHDQMTLGSLGAFVEYSMNIVWPMEMLGWLSNGISAAVASNRKIKKIIAETPTIRDPKDPVIPDTIIGKIEFSHVSYKGDQGNLILNDINFTVLPGKTIGIMGATGAGKSTIIQLLQRLYEPSCGTVCLDDINISTLPLSLLRGSISVVMQDVFLFSDTITENIRLGKKDSIDDDIITASAYHARASEFIERMDKQYETIIGERGVGLSGGQKQRISIARALAKQTPVLVMDDSTSALDTETEHQIWSNLNMIYDTTKVIIAHRISAVRSADEILFLDNGSIAERGTHETLMKKQGLYYETYLAQYRGAEKFAFMQESF
ncbi:MAG: ABC transporter ATP-binding protein [Lachnospiraceae bacterium]|nr:ABC transporter ATP-binding protein [Lachnospiraceae bacterium]MDD3659147.1 ABC transporter ATP-binding protein [Lachnospiraceae bacterium]